MTVVALASVKGSPGVTTCAMALTTLWRSRPAVLLECDPAGGDVVVHLGFTPGLVGLAAAVRHSASAEQIWQHAHSLPSGLRVVAAPVGAGQAKAAVQALVTSALLPALADDESMVTVVDCGRLDPGSPARTIVGHAALCLLLVRPRSVGLAQLAARLAELRTVSESLGLVLVGSADFSAAEISQTLGVSVLGQLPADRRGAHVVLSTGLGARRASQLPLVRSVRSLVDTLSGAAAVPRRAGVAGEELGQSWMVGRPVRPEQAAWR